MKTLLVASLLAIATLPVTAETLDARPALNLEASASLEVPEDTAIATLYIERQNTDVLLAQQQVNTTLSSAFQKIKAVKALSSKTGHIQTMPVYGKDGKITAWRVRNELVLESKDQALLSDALTRLSDTLVIGSVRFSLSSEAEKAAQKSIQGTAIEAFKLKAQAATEQFGYKKYAATELRLSENGAIRLPAPVMAFKSVARMDAASGDIPVVAGKTTVSVTVSGVVKLEN